MRLATRSYRALLRLLPEELRTEREEIARTFEDLAADAHRRRGSTGVALAWLRSAWGLVGCAAALRAERLRNDARMEVATARNRRERWRGFEMWIYDLRFALRSLRRAPGFAFGVVLLVALGVGTVTAVFSVVDGVLLRALPYPDAERLVWFGSPSHTGPNFREWTERLETLESVVATWREPVALTGVEAPLRIRHAKVTDGFFEFFGAQAVIGRGIQASDFEGPARVAVLGHGLWQNRFGSDPDVVGTTVSLGGVAHRIVGVMAGSFRPPEALTGRRVDVWTPLDFSHPLLQERRFFVLNVAGRLAPEASLAAAQSELDALAAALAEQYPEEETAPDGSPRETPLEKLRDATTGDLDQTLFLLLAAVGAMLLIACANVASLVLARATVRERELSLRAALGATRRRVTSLVLLESILPALVGGLLGFLLARLLLGLFRAVAPTDVPRLAEVQVDLRILGFTIVLSLLTGVLFGLAPALRSGRADVSASLREGAVGSTRVRERFRSALVILQVALALALAVGSGLLFHSFLKLRAVELGFEPERVVTVRLEVGQFDENEETARRRGQFAEALLEDLETLPGIDVASLSWTLPFDYTGGGRCCWRTRFGNPERPEQEELTSLVNPVSPDYFAVLGVPVLAGRAIQPGDEEIEPTPIVLNRHLADRLFPEGDAVGSMLEVGRDRQAFQVVGLVADFRSWGMDQEPESTAFVSYAGFGSEIPELSVALRSSLPADALAETLRQAIWRHDPDLPVEAVLQMDEKISDSLAEPRFYSTFLILFAALALTLASAGIYGSLLYAVGQRIREMGLRLALGAGRGDLLRMVVGRGLGLVLVGLVLGLGLTIVVGRLLESRLFGIDGIDPYSTVVACAVLLAVSLVASYFPARRAAGADPVETLRAD